MEGGSFAGGVTHLKQEEMKRKKSNQTAAHSVVAALASLPDISTTGKKPVCLLLALLALLRLFHSRSTYRNVSIRTSPTHRLIFTSSRSISHLYTSPLVAARPCMKRCSRVWPRPQEASFPLKHNYSVITDWPRNSSK